jgi:PAS domain S-box-containing protein
MPYFIRRADGVDLGRTPEISAEWAAFLDVTPAMVWLTDPEGNLLHVNTAWRQATGLGAAPTDRQAIARLVHPDDRDRILSSSPNFLGHPFSFEFRLRHADGSFRRVLERIQPWRDAEGRLIGYIGSSIDIQFQKEHEQKLALIALRQTSLTYFNRVALVQTAPEKVNHEALRLFCENLGVPAALLVLAEQGEPRVAASRGLAENSAPPALAAEALAVEYVLEYPADAQNFPLQESWLRAEGWAEAVSIPIDPHNPVVGCLVGLRRTAENAPIGPVHYARDLAGILAIAHERWRAERKLREGEERALQVQKMEAVGLLAGGVAHDFNNLLTAIRCFADLLRDELSDPAQRGKIDDILHASNRASHLVRQLLSFSRQEIAQPENLDLNQVVDELRGFIRSLLSEHVQIDFDLAERPAWCFADRKQIEQVLFNLCLNARDVMTTDGRLGLAVSVESGKNGGRVRLSVSDTGPGIPQTIQKRVFEPFFTTKARGRGTGLGLPTCLAIAKACGGDLTFETAAGQGTVFHLDLPEIADPLQTAACEAEPLAVSARVRIMLVEDDDLVRAVTLMLAETLGHRVVAFPGSAEALVYAQGDNLAEIDLLITDIVMPGMNGHELAEQILARKPGLPVFYMSGYIDDPITQEALARPGVFFLSKPFSSEEFSARLALILREPRD